MTINHFPTTPPLVQAARMAESNSKSRWPAYRRVPPFLPVPGRAREDGWTPKRQAQFIGYLAETGSVTEAARRVGISRMSAYRLRRGIEAESFAHAWDEVLAVVRGIQIPVRKVTYGELYEWALGGPVTVHMRRGRFAGARQKPCDRAALKYLRRFASHRMMVRRGLA